MAERREYTLDEIDSFHASQEAKEAAERAQLLAAGWYDFAPQENQCRIYSPGDDDPYLHDQAGRVLVDLWGAATQEGQYRGRLSIRLSHENRVTANGKPDVYTQRFFQLSKAVAKESLDLKEVLGRAFESLVKIRVSVGEIDGRPINQVREIK